MRPQWKVALSLWLILLMVLFTGTVFAQEATDEPAPATNEEADAPIEEMVETNEAPDPVEEQQPTSTPQPSGEATTYTVQAGDNLYRIALRFGTTTIALAAENNIANASQIFVGQVLRIPASGSTAPPPTEAQPTAQSTVAPTVAPPPATGTTYTVQRGDSLSLIAQRFGLNTASLKSFNGLRSDTIRVGQRLKVPGSGQSLSAMLTPSAVISEHTIARGETLSGIAQRYRISLARLREANNLRSDTIRVGQILIIPSS